MRYAVVLAGGSGTRLWPMSRAHLPKQLIELFDGKSLLQLAMDRLDGLVPAARQYICAGQTHQQQIITSLSGFDPDCYLAEPMGRDTLNAMGLAAAVIRIADPEAIIAVLTSDHVIEPIGQFQDAISRGFDLAEQHPEMLVTFGVKPTGPATSYGYLQLGAAIDQHDPPGRKVQQFREKPDQPTAQTYYDAGDKAYLWNSGMFVWRAATLLACIERYQPAEYKGLMRIAEAWHSDDRDVVLEQVYPTLKKISIDYAIMEPASQSESTSSGTAQVVAIPMHLSWLDVGSWPSFARTCRTDAQDNARGPGKHLLIDTHGSIVASSDQQHLIATIGCEDLIIIHTPDATLVCPAHRAEEIKALHAQLAKDSDLKYL
jgi:mannose-1-phosphate guanylyltransferase